VKQLPTKEVISKDYKIELLVKSTAWGVDFANLNIRIY
jgi:hypothetical protein